MSAKLRRWFRPCLEALEDRCLPSSVTFTVTNLKDDGSAGSLRKRVEAANHHPGPDAVVFKPGLTGTIKLFSGQVPISGSLTLLGPGASVCAPAAGAPSHRSRDGGGPMLRDFLSENLMNLVPAIARKCDPLRSIGVRFLSFLIGRRVAADDQARARSLERRTPSPGTGMVVKP